MRTPKVRLYIRVRRAGGRDAYLDPVWNRNRTLRAGYALADGQAEHHPEGCYYLRYLRNGKRVWQSVGMDADKAIVALRNTEHDLEAVSLGRTLVSQPEDSSRPRSNGRTKLQLSEATEVYLEEVQRFRAPKTIAACKNILKRFVDRYSDKSMDDISRRDLLDHMAALKGEGLSDRTISNHIVRINTLLKANGITGLLAPADKPKYDEKEVRAYHSDELAAIFAAATPEENLLFHFFLQTGFREQEVMYCTWANIDFKGKVISTRSKPEMGFRIKDKEERSVPVPDSLLEPLASRKRGSTSMLVFPGKNGMPNGHFLRTLQRLAFRAGQNCGECTTKGGKSCVASPVCMQWGLHSFRRTFATMHSAAKDPVPAPTIQRWLGHSDLSTTLRYLAVQDLRSEKTRAQVNGTFAALAMGGAA